MLTSKHQRLALVNSFIVRAGDTVLTRVYQFKYFGVMLNLYLSWNDQIEYIGRKISAKPGMLRKACKVIPRESCLTVYNAMVLLRCLMHGTPAVRPTEGTLISCKGMPPVLWKAKQFRNRRYLTNTLPLDLRSEHDINKFAFGLKRHLRSKSNLASFTFVILGYTICYLYLHCVLGTAPFKPASLNWASLTKYC